MMARLVALSTLAAVALSATGLSAALARAARFCDEACLKGFVDRYLEALARRDPSALPATRRAVFTENGVRLKLGEGLWGTATAVGAFRIYVADPDASQVGFVGVAKEHDTPVMLSLRLEVARGRITEIESLVGRSTLSAADTLKTPHAGFAAILPETERVSRAELIAIAHRYFDAIEASDGSVAPFAEDCERAENGVPTTHNPGYMPVKPGDLDIWALGCADQISSRGLVTNNTISPRRIWAVDEKRGLVMGYFRFNIPGTLTSTVLSTGKTMAYAVSEQQPFSAPVTELLRVEGGKIRRIESVAMPRVPYGFPSAFD